MTDAPAAEPDDDGPWRHRYVAANAARFHVVEAGPEVSDAPLVLLLHGFPQHWWAWRHQLPALADAGHRVAALDLRGAGASDKPPQGRDLPTLARDVAGVVRSLGAQEAIIVGHGLGGAIAWSMPSLHPGVTAAIGALAAPHPLELRARLRRLRPRRTVAWLAYFQLPLLPERAIMRGDLTVRLLREWGATPEWLDAEAEAVYREAMATPFAAHSSMETFRWMVRSMASGEGHLRIALRDQVTVPVLTIAGGADRCLPPRSDQRWLPRMWETTPPLAGPVRRRSIPDAGHFLPEEAPAEVSGILLDWLADLARARAAELAEPDDEDDVSP